MYPFLIILNASLVFMSSGNGEEVFDVTMKDSSQMYRAGPKMVLLRLSHGSAIITTASQDGKGPVEEYLIMSHQVQRYLLCKLK